MDAGGIRDGAESVPLVGDAHAFHGVGAREGIGDGEDPHRLEEEARLHGDRDEVLEPALVQRGHA